LRIIRYLCLKETIRFMARIEIKMSLEEVMAELVERANENNKRVLMRHGAKEPFYGVKVSDLKRIQKRVKKDHELALELYETGNSDAMYLAGLIADENRMTKRVLRKWVKEAYWYMLSEYTVAWITAESCYGFDLGNEWIEDENEMIAAAGWSTLANLVAIKLDKELDLKAYEKLLKRVEKEISKAPNRVRYTMNGFVIAVGSYIISLTDKAKAVAKKIGQVEVNMGETACRVPLATEYIEKVESVKRIGKKKKMARC